MKTMPCYDDSNTWGYDPATKDRLPFEQRRTGILDKNLGDSCRLVGESLNGRTTVWDDPIEGHKNGVTYLPPSLMSHKPVDTVAS